MPDSSEPRFRKYIAFGFDQYYPAGGLGDIVDSADTIDEAKALLERFRDFRYIVDRDTWQTVWESA